MALRPISAIALAPGAHFVTTCIRLGNDSKYPVGRLAGLCSAWGDVASLGAHRLARPLSLSYRTVLFPYSNGIFNHSNPVEGEVGLRGSWRKLEDQGLPAVSKAADDANSDSLLRRDAVCRPGGGIGHPPTLPLLFRPRFQFSHGIHGGLAIGDGPLLDAGIAGAILSGLASGRFQHPVTVACRSLFGCVALAPLSRMVIDHWFPAIHHSEAITLTALDYFGAGSLLALALHRGMRVGDKRLKCAAWLAFCGYAVLYVFSEMGNPIAGFCYIQQTLVSLVFVGLISSTLKGFGGWLGKVLNDPAIQKIGELSYGLYLFHTPVPLFLGFVLPWLWQPFFSGPWIVLRLVAYALASWGLAHLCRRYLETKRPAQT